MNDEDHCWEELRRTMEGSASFKDGLVQLGPGIAFHYTHPEHVPTIAVRGFLGAPIDPDLAATQTGMRSAAAQHPNGAVFAYELLRDAANEGAYRCPWEDCVVLEVSFKRAMASHHAVESRLPLAAKSRTLVFLASESVYVSNRGSAKMLSRTFQDGKGP